MSKLENNTASLQAVSEKINGVNNEINSQATTIAEIAELLNGKSIPGGGTSVETCTVEISTSNDLCRPYRYAYTKLDNNGNIITEAVNQNNAYNVILQNVICGSALVLSMYSAVNLVIQNYSSPIIAIPPHFIAYMVQKSPNNDKMIIHLEDMNSGGGSND